MSETLKKQNKNTKKDTSEKKSLLEKGSKFGRDFNLFVGGAALAGALIAPPVLAAGLGVYAGFNFLQAGGFEVMRRLARTKNKNKTKVKNKE